MLDLQLGTRGDVFSMPGQQSQVTGFDKSGTPIVYSSGPTGQSMWLLIGGFTPAPSLISNSSNGGVRSPTPPRACSNTALWSVASVLTGQPWPPPGPSPALPARRPSSGGAAAA